MPGFQFSFKNNKKCHYGNLFWTSTFCFSFSITQKSMIQLLSTKGHSMRDVKTLFCFSEILLESLKQITWKTYVSLHAQMIFVLFLFETVSCYVAQTWLKLLGSSHPPTSASRVARNIVMCHHSSPRNK